MKKLNQHVTLRSESLIDQIAQSLIEKIHQGEYTLNSRLPSVRKYASFLEVSNESVLRAYDKLVALGYLEARRGSGFYVIKNKRTETQPNKKWVFNNPNIGLWQRVLYQNDISEQSLNDLILPAYQKKGISLIQDALHNLNPSFLLSLSQYANPQGYLPFRERLQEKLNAQGIHAPASQIVTTNGAADALHLVIWSLFFPREHVMVEEPCSQLHVQRLMASGLEILRVPRLKDGPDLEALQALCEKYKPKALLLSSILQNPTSSCLSIFKAHQLLKLAEIHDFILIDDDSYGDLLPPTQMINVTRLANLDQFHRVIQIGSFSRTIAPGLRCGYIAANDTIIERIVMLYKSTGAIQSPLMTEFIMTDILENKKYTEHCARLHEFFDKLRQEAWQKLTALGWQIPETKAGIYLWGSFAQANKDNVLQPTKDLGFQIAPPEIFSRINEHKNYARFKIC